MMNRFRGSAPLVWFAGLALVLCVARPATAIEQCGIASAHELATRAGCEILRSGGNAFDAAVTVAAVLAVVEPFASGIGGGGFFLLHRASDELDVFVDARETAPARASRELLSGQDALEKKLTREGPTAAGIPGEPAALDWVANRYGTLPLTRLLAPAIRLAERGFPADGRYAGATALREGLLRGNVTAASIFLDQGKAVQTGFVLIQPMLARTLRMLAEQGGRAFYEGNFARDLTNAVNSAGGLWELSDLENYRVIERQPLRFTYRGAAITTAPLPSSGGLVLAQSLFILEPVHRADMPASDRMHFAAEAMRRGYHDRARYMGDPGFVEVPVHQLASRDYARNRGASIDPARATLSTDLAQAAEEGQDTTHFSIIDNQGNRVAATLSVNGPFGSGFVAGNTGVLLNNHMDDFAHHSGAPNMYKLIGGRANVVEPGKRPLSSMTPTFVEDDRGVLVLGTPGGSRIISMILHSVLTYLERGQIDLPGLVAAPRFHHQYLPDRIEIEPESFPDSLIEELRARGHTVEISRRKWGNMQIVFQDKKGRVEIANDPRGQRGVLF